MTHPNVELLRQSDKAMESGDIEGFLGHFADDVAVHLGGRSSLAGDYRGKDQFQEAFGRFMEAAGEYSFDNHAYLADDEHGVFLQKGTFSKDGRTFQTNEVIVVHIGDGKITEMWYLPADQAGFDAFVG
jgi:hypothetical protein